MAGFHRALRNFTDAPGAISFPVSPRVILATFERGKRRQRFCIRPLLQFTRAHKKDPGRRYIRAYIYIYTTVRINPLLRGRFRLVSSPPPSPFPHLLSRALFPLFAESFAGLVGGTRRGEETNLYCNTQCSLLQRVGLQISRKVLLDVINRSRRVNGEWSRWKFRKKTFSNLIDK